MLDQFLEVAYEAQQKKEAQAEMVEGFKNLPERELFKLATGQTKLAMYDGDDWLEKYKDTELYPEALQLEQQCLQAKIQQEQKRLAEQEERDSKREEQDEEWRAMDAIRLKKRILDLKLNQAELAALGSEGGEAGEEEESEEEEAEEEAEEPEAEEGEEEAEADNAAVAADEKAASDMKTAVSIDWVRRGARSGAKQRTLKGEGEKLVQSIRKARAPSPKRQAASKGLAEGMVEAARTKKASAALTKVAQPPAAQSMNPIKARRVVQPQLEDVALDMDLPETYTPQDVEAGGALLGENIAAQRGKLQEQAQYAQEHPVMNKLKGAVPGAVIGGVGGGLIGASTGGTGKQMLARGAIGAGLGALGMGGITAAATPGAAKRQETAGEYEAAEQALTPELRQALVERELKDWGAEQAHNRALALAEARAPRTNISQTTRNVMRPPYAAEDEDEGDYRYASAQLKLAAAKIRMRQEMEKEAWGPVLAAMGKGLQGMGQFAAKSGRQLGGAISRGAKAGTVAPVGRTLGRQAQAGMMRAGQWAAKNPKAALGIAGAGALGVGGLGYMAGRGSNQ